MYARFLSPSMYDNGLLYLNGCASDPCELCFVRLASGAPTKGEPEVDGL